MPIISYSQNFEDVILWRALGHVDHGFYIDIGANDPVVDSVSLAFYEKGWRGVHVEPVPAYARAIGQVRDGEDVEQVAVGANVGKITFYEIEGTGLSTLDRSIAERHRDNGFKVFEREVECVPLDRIFEKYPNEEIHWLKIDVEGGEKDVLSSWRLSEARPWIVIVESTIPLSQEENYQEWEDILVGKGYSFVYHDGLNRFYLHASHAELRQHFMAPPNVFDRFALSGRASNSMCSLLLKDKESLEEQIDDQKYLLKKLEAGNAELESRAERAEAAEKMLSEHLETVFSSRSWRITAPMRWVFHQIFLLRSHGVKSRSRSFARKVITGSIRYLHGYPGFRSTLISLAQCLGAKEYLKVIYQHYSDDDVVANKKGGLNWPVEAVHLGPHARQAYRDMRRIIDRQKEEV